MNEASVPARPTKLGFWSQTSIPGKPAVLMIDASGNREGWEYGFSKRLAYVLGRKGVGLASPEPLCVNTPEETSPALAKQGVFNSILLFGHGPGTQGSKDSSLRRTWEFLSRYEGMTPKLLALCTCERPDLRLSEEVLAGQSTFARLALAPETTLTPRAAGLFFMKFFVELDIHSSGNMITGKMVWFSYAKAKLLLERRAYPGRIGVRC